MHILLILLTGLAALLFAVAKFWPLLPIGTRSVIIGAHCFFIHPIVLAYSWYLLYGFPADPRLWVAFFVHDLGYIGKRNMDGEEGETHCELGARIMGWLFDHGCPYAYDTKIVPCSYYKGLGYNFITVREYEKQGWTFAHHTGDSLTALMSKPRFKWHDFTLFHSRFYAKKHNKPHSRLCVADKAAIYLTPRWLYLPMVKLTGELDEYMSMSARNGNTNGEDLTPETWHDKMCSYLRKWVAEFKDGRPDTWTPATR